MTGQPPRLVFRFTQAEVAKMEEVLHDLDAMPKRPVIQGLIDHFNASPDRSGNGKVPVQYNQVLGFPSLLPKIGSALSPIRIYTGWFVLGGGR